MNTPQVLTICLMSASLMLHLAKHGEDSGKYSFWHALIACAANVGILYWGGYWS